ncbi:BTAD domain-containing putative transcriptional regulator [Pseudoduganella violaceinigra]|uniref:BTAD domain-containing putative transcriptional regulator n=1 Tax=Pseudoduganella violaceinigra TaxID=246602 RepID=UPI0004033A3A|nr:BTAD domain-containing putative transcriptional regulator [Pseudoduganella violaceinigra]
MHEALPRPRLFKLLDAMRLRHKLVWLTAPGGAGKTTLAAGYLQHLGQVPLWYQFDNGDADPASLFFYLAQMLGERGAGLPSLQPELSGDVPRFARIFFRAYFAQLAPGSVLVFDNVQEFAWEHWGQLFEIACSEIPAGICVLALSRHAPPARLARFELDASLATLAWETLRFNADEARALASADGMPLDPAWLERADGWAAGIVIMRDHAARENGTAIPALEGHDAIFRYLAGEIFERAPAAVQRHLMMLSCLPAVSADDAEHLSQDPSIRQTLDHLYRNRLFIERRGGALPTYHFHALFRDFLQHAAQQQLPQAERQALLARAARILDRQGRTEEALQLYRDSGAFDALVAVLLEHAYEMMGTGRAQSWLHWHSWVPQAVVENYPRLWFWQGVMLNPVDPQRARPMLVRAEAVFAAQADVQWRLMSAATLVDNSYFQYGWRDSDTMSHWIGVMLAGLAQVDADGIDLEISVRIQSRLILALISSGEAPDPRVFGAAVESCANALRQIEDYGRVLDVIGIVLLASHWIALAPDMEAILLAALRQNMHNAAANPYARLHAVQWAAFRMLNLDGDLQAARELFEFNRKLVDEYGLDRWRLNITYFNTLVHLALHQLEPAGDWLRQTKQHLLPLTPYKTSRLAMLEGEYLRQSGDAACGLQLLLDGFERGTDNQATSALERARFERLIAGHYALQGEFDAAERWSQRAIADAYGLDQMVSQLGLSFLRAYACARRGDRQEAEALMRPAMQAHRAGRHHGFYVRLPQLASEIAALALSMDIEVEHVLQIIRRQNLPAPARAVRHWPWPVAVRTLGHFSVALNGAPLTAGGKTQQRPLLLLKALLGSGEAGRPLSMLMQLWSDVAAPKAALNAAIHRLRKLLGNDAAILVSGAKASLDRLQVWSDVDALLALCDRIDSLPPQAPLADLRACADELLELYRGPFCEGDDAFCLRPTRDRCRNRFLHAADALGQRLEARQEWPLAHDVYARANEAEPLAEAAYRGLMRCAQARRDPAAAFAIYRRCREVLSIVLNQQPSPETAALAHSLGLPPDAA